MLRHGRESLRPPGDCSGFARRRKGCRLRQLTGRRKVPKAAAKSQSKSSNNKAKPTKGATLPAAERQTAKDDREIIALSLQRGKLSPEMEAYFSKCTDKLGFVPNVLQAYAFDNAKLEA